MEKLGLCIGINDYPGTGSDLAGCVNDANDWAAALRARGFAVQLLLDRQADKRGMVSAITNVVAAARAGDLIVLQYSGHGSYVLDEDGDELDGTDEVLCPHDVSRNRPLADDELHDLLAERERGVRIVFISDSCHSGTVTRFAPTLDGERRGARVRFLPPAAFLPAGAIPASLRGRVLRRAASSAGRYGALLMAGCQDAELSYDAWFGDRANGAFTYVALRALETLDGPATYRDWHRAIRDHLPTAQYPQTPNLFGSSTQRRWRVFT